jgi:hypothetical protein
MRLKLAPNRRGPFLRHNKPALNLADPKKEAESIHRKGDGGKRAF